MASESAACKNIIEAAMRKPCPQDILNKTIMRLALRRHLHLDADTFKLRHYVGRTTTLTADSMSNGIVSDMLLEAATNQLHKVQQLAAACAKLEDVLVAGRAVDENLKFFSHVQPSFAPNLITAILPPEDQIVKRWGDTGFGKLNRRFVSDPTIQSKFKPVQYFWGLTISKIASEARKIEVETGSIPREYTMYIHLKALAQNVFATYEHMCMLARRVNQSVSVEVDACVGVHDEVSNQAQITYNDILNNPENIVSVDRESLTPDDVARLVHKKREPNTDADEKEFISIRQQNHAHRRLLSKIVQETKKELDLGDVIQIAQNISKYEGICSGIECVRRKIVELTNRKVAEGKRVATTESLAPVDQGVKSGRMHSCRLAYTKNTAPKLFDLPAMESLVSSKILKIPIRSQGFSLSPELKRDVYTLRREIEGVCDRYLHQKIKPDAAVRNQHILKLKTIGTRVVGEVLDEFDRTFTDVQSFEARVDVIRTAKDTYQKTAHFAAYRDNTDVSSVSTMIQKYKDARNLLRQSIPEILNEPNVDAATSPKSNLHDMTQSIDAEISKLETSWRDYLDAAKQTLEQEQRKEKLEQEQRKQEQRKQEQVRAEQERVRAEQERARAEQEQERGMRALAQERRERDQRNQREQRERDQRDQRVQRVQREREREQAEQEMEKNRQRREPDDDEEEASSDDDDFSKFTSASDGTD